MAGHRKNPRPWQYRFELGQPPTTSSPNSRSSTNSSPNHPCFFDGARLTRLSAPGSPVYALLRESAEGRDSVLVLVNTDVEKSHLLTLAVADLRFEISDFQFDLLGQPLSQFDREKTEIIFTLVPGACHCLAPTQKPVGLNGENYRRRRARAAWALQAFSELVPAETVDGLDWHWLAEQVESSPRKFSRRRRRIRRAQC